MEKRRIIQFLAISIIILAIIIILIFKSKTSNTSLEQCQTLQYNGEDKINLVFLSNKETTEKYSDSFFQISPFKENKAQFNIYYIPDYSPECEIYKEKAILCYSKEIIKKSSSCPNDYIISIKEQEPKIRSSSYMNILSLNSNHPLSVFPHEFAHAFAILAEEYVPASLPENQKNCQDSCEKFEIKDKCEQGCSESNYFRSIDSGIMRTLNSNQFGIFNEKIISEKITKTSLITGKAVEEPRDCNKEKYILISGTYSKNNTQLVNKSLEKGCLGKNGNGNVIYNLILEDNSTSKTENFNPEIIYTDTQGTILIEGEILQNDGNFYLKLPITENIQLLEINKNNETLAEINLEKVDSKPCRI